MKKKKKLLTKKQKRILIIIGVIILISLIIILIPLSNREQQNEEINSNSLDRELKTIQELVEYLESTYIREEESNEEDKLELDAFPQLMQNLQEEFAGRDYYDSMDEEQYKSFSERVTSKLKILQKFMPFLKTDAQLLLEQEIKEQQLAQAREEAIQESDDDWLSSDSWNSDIDWWEEKESGFIEDKVGSHNK